MFQIKSFVDIKSPHMIQLGFKSSGYLDLPVTEKAHTNT